MERPVAKGCWLCLSIWLRFTGSECGFVRYLYRCQAKISSISQQARLFSSHLLLSHKKLLRKDTFQTAPIIHYALSISHSLYPLKPPAILLQISLTMSKSARISSSVVAGPKLNLTAFSECSRETCMALRTGRLFLRDEHALPVEM